MKKITSAKRLFIGLLFLFLPILSYQVSAQDEAKSYDRTLSYFEFWKEILTCQEEKYELQNALVIEGEQDREQVDSLQKAHPTVKAEIYLHNITFETNRRSWRWNYAIEMQFNALHFEKNFTLFALGGLLEITFKNCQFDMGVCVFGKGTLEGAKFDHCIIRKQLDISFPDKKAANDHWLEFSFCQVLLEGNPNVNYYESVSGNIMMATNPVLTINHTIFDSDTTANWIGVGDLHSLVIDSSDFRIDLDLSGSHITERIEMKNSTFRNINWHGVSYPLVSNISFRWNQLQNKLSIINEEAENHAGVNGQPDFVTYYKKDYDGLNGKDIGNVFMYDELMAIYNKFFRVYRERGDLESANACYIDMKDVQTARLQFLYQENNSISNWMYWQLNVFLKYFADYGTNPVKALIVSMWTILQFAFLYFFFYSSWDKINRRFLLKQHRRLLDYFSGKQTLKDFYTEEHKIEYLGYQDYKRQLKRTKGKVPFFISVFGRPLYALSVLQFRVVRGIFKRTEIMHTSWVELSPRKKRVIGTKAFLGLIVYVGFLIFTRALNAIFLSINTFSTLGFGDIPVTGISRYIAILEGFIGWFLLSIFSVSLISQILQN